MSKGIKFFVYLMFFSVPLVGGGFILLQYVVFPYLGMGEPSNNVRNFQRFMCNVQSQYFRVHREKNACYSPIVNITADPVHGFFGGLACPNPAYGTNPVWMSGALCLGEPLEELFPRFELLAKRYGMTQVAAQDAVREIRRRCLWSKSDNLGECMGKQICRPWESDSSVCQARPVYHWDFLVKQHSRHIPLFVKAIGFDNGEIYKLRIDNMRALAYDIQEAASGGARAEIEPEEASPLRQTLRSLNIEMPQKLLVNVLYPKETRDISVSCNEPSCRLELSFDYGFCVVREDIPRAIPLPLPINQLDLIGYWTENVSNLDTWAARINVINLYLAALIGTYFDGDLFHLVLSVANSEPLSGPLELAHPGLPFGTAFVDAADSEFDLLKWFQVVSASLKWALENRVALNFIRSNSVLGRIITRRGLQSIVLLTERAAVALWVIQSISAVWGITSDCTPESRTSVIEITRSCGWMPLGGEY